MFAVYEDGIEFLALRAKLDEAKYVVEQEVEANLGPSAKIFWEEFGRSFKATSFDGEEKDQVFIIRPTR